MAAHHARELYEQALYQYEQKKITTSTKSTIASALDSIDGGSIALNTNPPPTKPIGLEHELKGKELLKFLQGRDFLYGDFETKFDQFRKDTMLLARWGMFTPLSTTDTYPAFPSADMVARLYQELNLFPKPQHPNLAPIDVEVLLPPSFPRLEQHERRSQFDQRKFDFGKAFEQITEFAPTSLEYHPYNFRKQNPCYLSQGLLGDEQFIISSFNKPPIEHFTGVLSKPENSKRS